MIYDKIGKVVCKEVIVIKKEKPSFIVKKKGKYTSSHTPLIFDHRSFVHSTCLATVTHANSEQSFL